MHIKFKLGWAACCGVSFMIGFWLRHAGYWSQGRDLSLVTVGLLVGLLIAERAGKRKYEHPSIITLMNHGICAQWMSTLSLVVSGLLLYAINNLVARESTLVFVEGIVYSMWIPAYSMLRHMRVDEWVSKPVLETSQVDNARRAATRNN